MTIDFGTDLRILKRLRQITSVMFKHGFGYLVDKAKLNHHLPFYQRLSIKKQKASVHLEPAVVRKIFEELGGAYIKLAQLLSVRPDLVPPILCEELKKLRDEVKEFPYKQAKAIVEEQLKKPLSKVFISFDKKPIGSASISQVHRAKLLTGEEVVVKIKRLGIARTMDVDIEIMKRLSALFEKHVKIKHYKPSKVISEFEQYTEKELDFSKEAENIRQVYDYAKSNKHIVIPKIYPKLCTEDIIVMDYIKGEKLRNADKFDFDTKAINRYLTLGFLKQVLEDGIFHADLHSGNIILVSRDSIGLVDFGIVGFYSPELREKGVDLILALVRKDAAETADIVLEVSEKDMGDEQKEVFKQDIKTIVDKLYNPEYGNLSLATALYQLVTVCVHHDVDLPMHLVLFIKGLLTLEGTCYEIDQDYNFLQIAHPYIVEYMKKQKSPKKLIAKFIRDYSKLSDFLSSFPSETAHILGKIDKGRLHIEFELDKSELVSITSEMERTNERLILAIIFSALLIVSALMINVPAHKTLGMSTFSFVGFSLAALIALIILRKGIYQG